MDLVKVSIEPKKLAKYTLKRVCLRDFNLSESRGTNTLKCKHAEHENMQLNLKTTPSGLPFKDQGRLAKHPLICHHQGVFGYQENARK